MRNHRSIIQILSITFGTLALSLVGIAMLIGEVRQEILRMIVTSIAFPHALRIPQNFWHILLALALAAMIYLVVRWIVSNAIPRLSKANNCPKCDGRLQRVHRHQPERIVSTILLLYIGRYGCINCEWNGLRRHHKHRDN